VESESLPRLGTAPSYELRSRAGAATLEQQFDYVDEDTLWKLERRIAKHLCGSGVLLLHDLAVPATATTIDHLCIGPNAITAIDIERDPKGQGRPALVERVQRETEILAAFLTEAGITSEQISGTICRSGRGISLRSSSAGPITISDPRGVAKVARRRSPRRDLDVQLALAVVRNRLGYEAQRSHRITRPDGF
jgi:hypothetical protein